MGQGIHTGLATVRRWLATRHAWQAELLGAVGLYLAYELARGLGGADPSAAVQHARALVALQRSLGVFVEPRVQHAAATVPSLTVLLGVAYLTMHLSVTGATLIWLFRRQPSTFVVARTALVLSTALSVVVFVVYPVAPPRLAGISLRDTVSGGLISLNHGLLHSLYNPFAAVPSLHFGYAVIVGVTVVRHARRPISRVVGAAYPMFVLFTIVATGNHFFVDAAAGGSVVAVGAAAAFALQPGSVRSTRLDLTSPAPSRRKAINKKDGGGEVDALVERGIVVADDGCDRAAQPGTALFESRRSEGIAQLRVGAQRCPDTDEEVGPRSTDVGCGLAYERAEVAAWIAGFRRYLWGRVEHCGDHRGLFGGPPPVDRRASRVGAVGNVLAAERVAPVIDLPETSTPELVRRSNWRHPDLEEDVLSFTSTGVAASLWFGLDGAAESDRSKDLGPSHPVPSSATARSPTWSWGTPRADVRERRHDQLRTHDAGP